MARDRYFRNSTSRESSARALRIIASDDQYEPIIS